MKIFGRGALKICTRKHEENSGIKNSKKEIDIAMDREYDLQTDIPIMDLLS